jgi:hypothetical protein
VADDEVREISEDELTMWKEEARQVAVSGYHLVLEDRLNLSDSSDDADFPVDELNMHLDVRLDMYMEVGISVVTWIWNGRRSGYGFGDRFKGSCAGIVVQIPVNAITF